GRSGRWAREVDEGVEGAQDGTAGVEDVVHQNDDLSVDVDRDLGSPHYGLNGHHLEIVPVERDVENSQRDSGPFDLADEIGQPASQGHPSPPYPDQHDLFRTLVTLHDFVGDAGQHAPDPFCIGDPGFDLQFTLLQGHDGDPSQKMDVGKPTLSASKSNPDKKIPSSPSRKVSKMARGQNALITMSRLTAALLSGLSVPD